MIDTFIFNFSLDLGFTVFYLNCLFNTKIFLKLNFMNLVSVTELKN